ncbi:MAG: molybdopterin molybdotransferase MoeA [Acidobacteriota bacterium]
MATLTFAAARQMVLDRVAVPPTLTAETVWLTDAAGRINAFDVPCDRDMPPLARSLRDGFAVRSSDLGQSLRLAGEIRAGQMPQEALPERSAFAIMTGAILPPGADQIVMKEHGQVVGGCFQSDRPAQPREWISEAGSMARAGDIVIPRGKRMDAAAIGMLAAIGKTQVEVVRRPVVRILATGDEVVDIALKPNATQVRNSNSWALAAEVSRRGGRAEILPIAPDRLDITRDLIAYGLEADLLLISGGVSAGDYDFVEAALAELGAEFFFDRVLIQPGQPTVFGHARGTFFFGLPGNPLSTLVTFHLFATAALERLAGLPEPALFFHRAQLAAPYSHKPGLTRFLPGERSEDGRAVSVLPWQGSGDIPTLVRANCMVVIDSARPSWAAKDWIEVLLP